MKQGSSNPSLSHVAALSSAFGLLALSQLVTPACAQNPAQTVNVDPSQGRRAISPLIYGTAFATPAQLLDLNCPLNRSGGNTTSRYNWQINADNRGFDWFFQSLAKASSTPGEDGDTFFANSRSGGAEPMLTIPTTGWVAKLGPNRGKLASFSIQKYGAQQNSDWEWMPDAGNGVRPNGTYITGNDPNDANVPVDTAFQRGWIDHLVNRHGTAANGGLKYYIMDNEPSIWFSTHRDVRPTGVTMEQVRDDIVAYGTQVKAADPSAQVVGPEEWGWTGYILSGYDQQYGAQNGWGINPDRTAHGGMDYLPWLLSQLKAHETQTGKRLLDIFTVHYYPQGGEFSNDVSDAMKLRRNRSTRSLWDPNYTDETWIADKVRLVPRLKNWVDTHYPNTKIGVTEYNWGAESDINGATAQADVYGIFGREGLDIANRWTTPATNTPAYNAMKIYRNYDGNKSTFGETSVQTTVANPDNLSAFSAVRADGALTVMVVSKYLTGNTPVSINLANFSGTTAQAWQLAGVGGITRVADVNVNGGVLATTVPSPSVTLFVIAPAATGNFTIRGRIVTGNGAPMAGLNVTRNGTGNVATNANGEFTFSGVAAGSYTIAPVVPPALIGATFAPATYSVTVANSNVANITFTILFAINGRVANHSGAGIAGVQVKRVAGASTVSTFTDANGNYRLSGVRSGSYTVSPVITPAMSGMNFSPLSLNATVDKNNITNINFIGIFSISGNLANHSGAGIANVQIQRTAGASVVSVFTNNLGNYRFTDVRSGDYELSPVITPAMTGMSFSPTVRNVTVGTLSITNQNFIGMFSVSGRVATSAGAAIANVPVRLTVGGSTTTVSTDASGNYRFANVRSGNYTVTPVMSGRAFAPTSRSVAVGTLNVAGINFVGTG